MTSFHGRFRAMLQVRLYLDYMDPGSLLMDRRLAALVQGREAELLRLPWEVRRPPEPLLDPRDTAWTSYWESMVPELREEGVELQAPERVPWTRKAHELALHARAKGVFEPVHRSLFQALLVEGMDLGRVDVLVELGRQAGLDHSETKAALDVDRYAEELDRIREEARERGVRGVPTLVLHDRILEGIHPPEAVDAFLAGSNKE